MLLSSRVNDVINGTAINSTQALNQMNISPSTVSTRWPTISFDHHPSSQIITRPSYHNTPFFNDPYSSSPMVRSISSIPIASTDILSSTSKVSSWKSSNPENIFNLQSLHSTDLFSLKSSRSTDMDHLKTSIFLSPTNYVTSTLFSMIGGNNSFSNSTVAFNMENPVIDLPYNSTEVMLLLAFFLIFFCGTLGNGCVYYYFGMKKKSKRSIPELLFSYLAMFDFTASVINPMLYIYFTLNRNKWSFGVALCKSTLTLGAIVTTISGGIFIIIAFDRERCIVFPFKSHYKPKTIKICVVIAILYAILMNFHYALNLEITPLGQCTVGNVQYVSYWVPTMICFVIQDLTLIFVFAFTNMRIFNHIKSKDTTLFLGALWGKRKKDSTKIIRLLVVLATVFFVLTLPRDIFLISHMMSWISHEGDGIRITAPIQSAYYFIKVLHTANSCVNVFIYYHMHRGFRRHINYHVLCLFYGTEPQNHTHFLDTLITADNSPNILRKIGSPIRSRSTSASREVAKVDERLIDSVNLGRKRNATDRRRNINNNGYNVASPLVNENKQNTNLLTVVVRYGTPHDSGSESEGNDSAV